MKLVIKIYILAGVLLMVSCKKNLLTETPIDHIAADYVLTTESGLNSGVTGLYNLMRGVNFPEGTGGPFLSDAIFRVATDLGLSRVTLDLAYDPNRYTPGGQVDGTQKWTPLYAIVERCNAIIAAAPDINMDQTKKDVLIAQVRAFRAETYMNLLTIYGNIVFKEEPTTADNIKSFKYEAADPAAVWALINADLDFAISKLAWSVPAGRYGQAVVRHIRGVAAMWQGDWQTAVNQFDAIVANGTYGLIAIDQVFKGNRNHKESLYTYQCDQATGGSSALAGGGPTAYASCFTNRYYELSSGEMIPDVKYGGLTYGWAYPNDYLKSLYDQANDKRFTTYYFDMNGYVVNNPSKANFGQPLPASSLEDNFRRYHFSLKKFFDENKPAGSSESYQNFIKYRFAETLLFGAEAHCRLVVGNAFLSGTPCTDPTALQYINMIRERAFGNSSQNYTQITLNNYLDEHARELALEGTRWFLLKRIGLEDIKLGLPNEFTTRITAHIQAGSNSGNVTGRNVKAYMMNWPIPQSQIDLMGTFPQNPGY